VANEGINAIVGPQVPNTTHLTPADARRNDRVYGRAVMDHNSVSLMKADDTEPIFVLRAQDSLAAAVVRFWADEAEKAGSTPAKIAEAREVAEAMEQWPTRKIPDSEIPD
jgi:hypothetical protein